MKIVGISIDKRTDSALKVQEILTRYGDNIIGRFGIHDPEDERGLITLNMKADERYMEEFLGELMSLEGVRVKYMDMD
ncbi:hypothetical protein [Caldanaerobius fijiensis]|nr:hypothetical protein [Caldanaerobius fijiensis]